MGCGRGEKLECSRLGVVIEEEEDDVMLVVMRSVIVISLMNIL